MTDTVTGLLSRHGADCDRIFLVLEDGLTVTYAEQLARSRAVAIGLRRRGLRPGDRVHVALPNCREFLDVWFGTALTGTVLVPTSPQSTAAELDHVLADATPVLSIRTAGEVDALRAGGDDGAAAEQSAAVSAILHTSGTTSRAKGVMVTDANYVAAGRAVEGRWSVTAADRWLVVLPLYHANAQYYCVMSALVAGASIALAPRFSASRWGRQVRDMRATLASLFAAPVRMILASPPQPDDDLNQLRAVGFAQNLSDIDAATFEQRFGTRLLQLYGMTETVVPPTMNPDDGTRRWDSIGRPVPEIGLDLIDPSDMTVAGPGLGEMRIVGRMGETIAAGYWNNPQATAGTFTVAGLRTGDLARRDADGFLCFVDRTKDMIKRGGENVSAGEVERVASEHPAVAECAAVGVPDPIRDEAILLIATVRPNHELTSAQLLDWCAQHLSSFKVPSSVVFVDALPRTSVGKVRKTELRSLYQGGAATPHLG